MKPLLALALLLLCSCNDAVEPTDCDHLGSYGKMALWVEKGATQQQRTWLWDSAAAYWTMFSMGGAWINSRDRVMNFAQLVPAALWPQAPAGYPPGYVMLCPAGRGVVVYPTMVHHTDWTTVVFVKGRASGGVAMGPGLHFYALREDGVLEISIDSLCTGRGLMTGLQLRYNADTARFPPRSDVIQWYRVWSFIYAADDAIADGIASAR